MKFVRKHGLKQFLDEQKKRQNLLELMLGQFNEGRSRTFYCVAATVLPVEALKKTLNLANKKVKEKGIGVSDLRSKAKILKEILSEVALKEQVVLKLRKPSNLKK